ncbi:hypothetical protein [Larsenimonas rhizosphaerae]|uniref:hypothetical protein n=1 Tax=Larsenimonas rhizosphaerae TaxID=2944682 RepID=UPI002033747B|nr:hypothetical protein [Larsenimonas rhizosphaerae]MCM2130623.1 hypothetical protein [Larsenimonas rhizosphaerae]
MKKIPFLCRIGMHHTEFLSARERRCIRCGQLEIGHCDEHGRVTRWTVVYRPLKRSLSGPAFALPRFHPVSVIQHLPAG